MTIAQSTTDQTGARASTTGAQREPSIESLNSLTAGLIIHRVGQINYGFADEARSFARDLQGYMNVRLNSQATTLVYEEIMGSYGRMHWLVHMKDPSDYGRLLKMVDHDKAFREIYEGDRLPERGGGNWERMFVQGSFRENVMVPQHGFAKQGLDQIEEDRFVPPARHQLERGSKDSLNSSPAGILVVRTVQASYEARDLARYYLYDWLTHVNRAADGALTATLFEEIWGCQDRLHVLLHMRSLDDYRLLFELESRDAGLREMMAKPRITISGQPLGWGRLFQHTSMGDTVLVPLTTEPSPRGAEASQ
ncbi:MAG: sle [Myxococcaceae bacterium]|nr:sle [Myxococcaceae bacterium]